MNPQTPSPMPFETRASERLIFKPDTTLEIINNNGRIELVGWDRPDGAVELQTRANEQEKLRWVSSKLTPTRNGYRLEIIEKYPPVDAYDYRRDGPGNRFWPALTTLTVRVPRNLTVKVQSHNADLALTNLIGALNTLLSTAL
ncbi:MAG: hypothetical protein QM758_01760 [Armatimonas sp.]